MKNNLELFNKRELEVIGRIIDSNRDMIATRLISLEALKKTECIIELHKRFYASWEEFNIISDKFDKIRGIEKNE